MTDHMRSGFNLMGNLALCQKLPDDIQAVIGRNATSDVRRQGEDQGGIQRRVCARR